MISIFKNCKDKVSFRNLDILSYFDSVKNGEWQDTVLNYRAMPDGVKDSQEAIAKKAAKEKNICITASGVFKERTASKIIEHSGFICLDIDAKDQIAEFDIKAIINDPYTFAVHKSVGGAGYAVFVKVEPDRHLDAFLGLENYYFVNHSIVLDKSCKDTSRLRFVSYDPDLFLNDKAKTFKSYLKKKEVKKLAYKPIVVKSDFDAMVNTASSMNLFDDYSDYIKLAFALVSEFGESGRYYFHSLCRASSKYNQEFADKHYSKALNRDGTGVSIASVYYKFKDAGIALTSEKTERIKSIVKLSENPKETLKELNIIDEDNLADSFAGKVTEKNELDLVIDLIKLSNIKFNEITRNFEIKNEELNDRFLAKFYTQVWTKIDPDFSKDKVWTLIQNRDNSKSYNPILQWFEKHKNLTTDNEFTKLCECFTINHLIYREDNTYVVSDYLKVYLKKWLLGIIGSAHGTYSLMILVLSGEQGIKKTEFFRNLLPKGLRQFYAESNLDDGKDSEILMTKKLLIIDDEFGGKTKKDATKLKRLSSQQTFSIRMPYGRISEDLKRLAVLGGTSNDAEIINDPTGNRRIIPINLIEFDFEKYIEIDKDKLFIELYREWESDKNGWFLTKNQIEFLNQSTIINAEVMSEVELIEKHFEPNPYMKMTNSDVRLALEKHYPSIKTNTKRIGQALKICGFEQKIELIGGKTKRIYDVTFK